MEGKWPYNGCFVGCYFQDFYQTARSINAYFQSSIFFLCIVKVQLVLPYNSTDTLTAWKNPSKRSSSVDSHTLTHQCWLISEDIFISSVRTLSRALYDRDGWREKERERERERKRVNGIRANCTTWLYTNQPLRSCRMRHRVNFLKWCLTGLNSVFLLRDELWY